VKKREIKQESGEPLVQFTVRLPVWLHREARIKALKEGVSMQSVIQKVFADFVKGKLKP